ncbi:MAG: hypothetical protein CK527_05515 [Nitrosarchaeum sp.]|nr:MAG: hypothetical protein CK527_05515 [Nitrosarchaeum sp.]
MGNSLGDYLREQSSLLGANSVKWTQKNTDPEKTKKKKTEKKTSPTNIIYTDDVKVKPHVDKIFKIEEDTTITLKREKIGKRFETSAASNFKVPRGYKRKGR